MSPVDDTLAVYRDVEGAAAYRRKEALHEVARRTTVYRLFDGVDLRGKRVLDVGCGFGRDVAEFRQRGADAYGCDGSEVLLADVRAEVGDFFKVCDVLREPLPWGGDFDFVWSCMLLVHVPRDQLGLVMAKMWQCLRPGGQLLVSTKWGEGERMVHNLGADKPRLMVYYREEELAAEVARLGGEVVHLDLGATLATGDRVMELVAGKP